MLSRIRVPLSRSTTYFRLAKCPDDTSSHLTHLIRPPYPYSHNKVECTLAFRMALALIVSRSFLNLLSSNDCTIIHAIADISCFIMECYTYIGAYCLYSNCTRDLRILYLLSNCTVIHSIAGTGHITERSAHCLYSGCTKSRDEQQNILDPYST